MEKIENKTNRIESRHASTAKEIENEQSNDSIAMHKATKILQDTQEKFQSMVDSVVRLKEQIQSTMDQTQDILANFRESEIELRVADHFQDEDLALNENVVLPLIAELEEYIYSLEVHMAYQNKERLAAAKAVPFKIMPTKNHMKKHISIAHLTVSNELIEDPQPQDTKKPIPKEQFKTMAKEYIIEASRSFDQPQLKRGMTKNLSARKSPTKEFEAPPKRSLNHAKTMIQ